MLNTFIALIITSVLVACGGQISTEMPIVAKPGGQVVGNGKEVTLIEASSDGAEVAVQVYEVSDAFRKVEFLYDISEDGKFTISDRAKITYLETGELEKIPTTGQKFEINNLALTLTDNFLLVSDGVTLANYNFESREWEISKF